MAPPEIRYPFCIQDSVTETTKNIFNDTQTEKLQKQLHTKICKNRIFPASDYCVHKQLKLYNSIDFNCKLL